MIKISLNIFINLIESCCCSAHFGMWNCFCNIFNCNCDTTSSGYCQYTDAATALTLGCIRTYPHWNELACSRNRITELQVCSDKLAFLYLSKDRLHHINYGIYRMEITLPRFINQRIFLP